MRKKRNYLIHHYLLNKTYAFIYFTANFIKNLIYLKNPSLLYTPLFIYIFYYYIIIYTLFTLYYFYIITLHYYFIYIIILYYFIFYIIILYYYLYYYHIYLFPVLKIISLLKSHR